VQQQALQQALQQAHQQAVQQQALQQALQPRHQVAFGQFPPGGLFNWTPYLSQQNLLAWHYPLGYLGGGNAVAPLAPPFPIAG
jgi:hypothetical protein